MRHLKGFSVLALSCFAFLACDPSASTTSALKDIASTANDALVQEIMERTEQNVDMPMSYVLANKERFGLSELEITQLRETFGEDELNSLVLQYLDPKEKRGLAQIQWAYIPNVPDDHPDLGNIESVNKDGVIRRLRGNTDEVPDDINFPIITLSHSERFQAVAKLTDKLYASDPSSDGAMMIDRIRFEKDHEPWIKGAAEVYMVVSYFDKEGKGSSELIELPAIDDDKRDYDLRQIAHIWNKNKYQIANLAFFEHDSGQDYSSLVKAFLTAASGIASAVIDPTKATTVAVVGIVSQLANAIVDALPKGTFTDDDDFMDQVNTIEKYKTETRSGVGGNVRVDIRHYDVKINDE